VSSTLATQIVAALETRSGPSAFERLRVASRGISA